VLIKTPKPSQLSDNDVTDEQVYHDRRNIIKKLGYSGAMALLSSQAVAGPFDWFSKKEPKQFVTSPLTFNKTGEQLNPLSEEEVATSYNNFYEFGTSKSDPKENAQEFKVNPWQLEVTGMVETPLRLDYDDIFSRFSLEERIYRLRCVEAWSMVIPWIGFSLGDLLKAAKPLSSAKYVAFHTLYDPDQMPGQSNRFIGGGVDYPYVEGLRIDEAMHIKSVVKIELTDKEPPTSWNILIPSEYGFYANVNPKVDHPRWSQARERLILGSSLNSQKRIDTQMFNGYSEVASLYSGMDLAKYY